jgi:hypothetical protein
MLADSPGVPHRHSNEAFEDGYGKRKFQRKNARFPGDARRHWWVCWLIPLLWGSSFGSTWLENACEDLKDDMLLEIGNLVMVFALD